mgnify:CR=1 FL=1
MIEKEADAATSTLRFEVRDTGIGIAPQRKAELFKPFTQAERSTTRHYGGTGLGLAICQSLVTAMGGTIDVESELGLGSLFWFEIPFERGAAVIRSRAAEALPTVSSRLRILIVDDVASNRELLAEVLGHQGHELLFAEEGAAAVAIAAAERPDVILMDVQMPKMDGIEATMRIRQLPPPADAVVILGLTAFAMATERARCLAAGMNLCLTKPVVLSDLLAALGTVAARSRPTFLQQGAGRRRKKMYGGKDEGPFINDANVRVEDLRIRFAWAVPGLLVDSATLPRTPVGNARRRSHLGRATHSADKLQWPNQIRNPGSAAIVSSSSCTRPIQPCRCTRSTPAIPSSSRPAQVVAGAVTSQKSSVPELRRMQ